MYVCMKINKTVCLDDDLVKFFKEKEVNLSQLLNELLKEAYHKQQFLGLSVSELKKAKEKLLAKKQYEETLRAIDNE